jgi:hypothetical protein
MNEQWLSLSGSVFRTGARAEQNKETAAVYLQHRAVLNMLLHFLFINAVWSPSLFAFFPIPHHQSASFLFVA